MCQNLCAPNCISQLNGELADLMSAPFTALHCSKTFFFSRNYELIHDAAFVQFDTFTNKNQIQYMDILSKCVFVSFADFNTYKMET